MFYLSGVVRTAELAEINSALCYCRTSQTVFLDRPFETNGHVNLLKILSIKIKIW